MGQQGYQDISYSTANKKKHISATQKRCKFEFKNKKEEKKHKDKKKVQVMGQCTFASKPKIPG